MKRLLGATVSICLLLAVTPAWAQVAPSATGGLMPNIEGQLDTPLRYHPDGGDFVIRNGSEFFNRALYGGNTAFRVDGGDKPEFSLYLPGRGGNVRLGIKTAQGVKWLSDASHIVTRYRPGELLYVITDPLLGRGRLEVEVLAYHQTEGLIVRAEGQGLPAGAQLVFAYGGGNGQRGVRDGDIGTEKVPISQYFQFKPEYAADDRYALTNGGFTVDGKAARFAGIVSGQAELRLADAAQWANAQALLSSSSDAAVKVLVGQVKLGSAPVFLSVQVTSRPQAGDLSTYSAVTAPGRTPAQTQGVSPLDPAYKPAELAKRFDATRRHFENLRNRVRVETPDPYLDAAIGSLNVAADALWDERQGGIMHGAIAWRTKLLGWRGPYALDALGWHDRARRNFDGWTVRQNADPIPAALPPADEDSNLARNEVGLHSNGDMSNSHYDMNIGFIDAMFRHILWTGDLDYARKNWPVIERHLAWEKRLFRREYGPEKLPLYEAYAAIWASDDMQYNGGGVAYTSAYNLYHNRMAARVAALIGKDGSAYAREAELIGRGMRQYLWMPDRGAFGEFRDLLGGQMLHPSYGLWSFYHTIDSGVPDGFEAAQMAADLERHLKPIPVRGEGVPVDRAYHVLPSSDWMPYSWSLNNVVMGENLHTALALWQAGDAEDAYTLTRGSLLASFYMGIAPGNIGSLNYLDVYRREAQRDFADGAGVMSRAIIEGLFGVKPDALDKTLRLTPGFPKDWNHASLSHPDLGLAFKRDGANESWTVSQTGMRFTRFVLDIPVRQEMVDVVTIDGREVHWSAVRGVGAPKLRIEGDLKKQAVVKVAFKGAMLDLATAEVIGTGPDPRFTAHRQGNFEWWTLAATPGPKQKACDIQAPRWAWMSRLLKTEAVDLSASFNAKVTEIFAPGKYLSPRSPHVSLAIPAQGIGAWAGHVKATANIDDAALRAADGEVRLPNGVSFKTPAEGANIVFTSQWDNYPDEATVPLSGRAKRAFLMMAGSTNAMQSRVTNGEVIVTYTDGTETRMALSNPQNWWPIERDYFIDDYQFQLCGETPVRFDLKTGTVHIPGQNNKGRKDREKIDGGAANILDIELDATRTLKSLTVRSVANEVVIGLMAVSLER
ncbi:MULTISPECIES: DUF4450 domain-containing protein [Asticcacaulis]|uniref:DUF4450 domain-containing protein n=1 Tax=Asticcacaulis TaxID=76890 RepID=UPI001FD98482|nr:MULTISPECIES: DUF4450 domain-containing protein [Asticcacaulis]MBP2161007.1 hypothetical protein [Asticcacaulis solisilvae]MDR6802052.1 hypothetical protein [Asticcacaulis sp. BE141]